MNQLDEPHIESLLAFNHESTFIFQAKSLQNWLTPEVTAGAYMCAVITAVLGPTNTISKKLV